jgi:hypothetical protein
MSSTDSSSKNNEAKGPRSSVALVAGTMALLIILVWALRPAKLPYQPAPLHPQPSGCPRIEGDFAPSDLTEVPGVSLEGISKEAANRVLFRLNMEPCPCGCKTSIAACRFSHPQCEICKDLARKIVAQERGDAQP